MPNACCEHKGHWTRLPSPWVPERTAFALETTDTIHLVCNRQARLACKMGASRQFANLRSAMTPASAYFIDQFMPLLSTQHQSSVAAGGKQLRARWASHMLVCHHGGVYYCLLLASMVRLGTQ